MFAHGQEELQAHPGDANVWTRRKSGGNTMTDVLSGGLKAGAAAASALDLFPSLKDFLPADDYPNGEPYVICFSGIRVTFNQNG